MQGPARFGSSAISPFIHPLSKRHAHTPFHRCVHCIKVQPIGQQPLHSDVTNASHARHTVGRITSECLAITDLGAWECALGVSCNLKSMRACKCVLGVGMGVWHAMRIVRCIAMLSMLSKSPSHTQPHPVPHPVTRSRTCRGVNPDVAVTARSSNSSQGALHVASNATW